MVINKIHATLISAFLFSFLIIYPINQDYFTCSKSFRRMVSISPISFTSDTIYGPYKGGETVTFSWEYINVSFNTYSALNDYFIVTCPSYSSTPILTTRVSRHSSKPGQYHSLSYRYTIPSSRINMESGLVIKVGVQYNGGYIALLEKTIKPIDSQNINPLNYRSTPYTIKDRSFAFNEGSIEESFLFDEYQDYVEVDPYYRLLFNNLSFVYQYPSDLTYRNVKIKFLDTYNLYPYIKKDGDGYTYVSAGFVFYDDNRVSLQVTNLWCDPITLRCDDHGMWKKSKYLYVPKGKGDLVSEYEFIIEANGLGINQTSFSHCLETSVSPFFIGDCTSADYCVVGGIKE